MEGRHALQEIMYLWCMCLWYAMSSWIMTHHNYEKLQDCIHHNDDTQPWSVEEHGSVFWKRRFSSVSQDCISQNSVYKGYCIVDRGSVIELKQRRKQPGEGDDFFLYNYSIDATGTFTNFYIFHGIGASWHEVHVIKISDIWSYTFDRLVYGQSYSKTYISYMVLFGYMVSFPWTKPRTI